MSFSLRSSGQQIQRLFTANATPQLATREEAARSHGTSMAGEKVQRLVFKSW